VKEKRRRHFRCPSCHTLGGRIAFWGEPPAEVAEDDVFIAGCCLEMDPETDRMFDRGCIECNHLWSSGTKG
jgi:hypothetical protein